MNDYEDKMSLICGFCFSSYVSPKAATFSSALPDLRKRGKGGLTKEILGVMMCVRDVVFHPGEEVRVYTDKLALVVFFILIHSVSSFLLLDVLNPLGHPQFSRLYFPMKTCIPHTPTQKPTQRQTLLYCPCLLSDW